MKDIDEFLNELMNDSLKDNSTEKLIAVFEELGVSLTAITLNLMDKGLFSAEDQVKYIEKAREILNPIFDWRKK